MFTLKGLPILADEIDVLTELKSQLAMNGVYRFAQFKQVPNHIQFPCPMHKEGQEKKPSCGITTAQIRYADGRVVEPGTVHCFACGYVASLSEMISTLFGHENDDGHFGDEWLAKNFVTLSVEKRPELKLNLDRHKSKTTNKQIVNYITEEELDSYRYIHPYMYTRKLTDEIIELFDIGYDKQFKITASDGHINNYRCLTFPNRDINGNTLFIARRSVDTKFFHYPKDVIKPVYGLYEITVAYDTIPNEIIICESMLDALHFWVVGKCAVALNGLGTAEQFKQLNELPTRKFILCTDSDTAGMNARKKIKANLKNKLVTQYILPEGRKDANECTDEELLNLEETFCLL